MPDCRAYEMVSPVDKSGGDALGYYSNARSSADGERAVFGSFSGFAGTASVRYVVQYLAQRTSAGWSASSLIPQQNFGGSIFNAAPSQVFGFSPDLSKTIGFVGDPGYASGAQPGTLNLYSRDSASGAFSLVTPVGVTNGNNVRFATASDDFTHILFESSAKLTPDAPIDDPGGFVSFGNLYEYFNGQVRFVGILPDGSPAPSNTAAGWVDPNLRSGALGHAYTQDTMSSDGSRIFWTDVATHQVYARLDGNRTLAVSASQRSTPDPNGTQPAEFQSATRSGSVVYFISAEKLTNDSSANGGASPGTGDIYAYDVATHQLTDLMAVPGRVATGFGVLGVSANGSHVYFAASGDPLAAGAPASRTNVYLWNNGVLSYVTSLSDDGTDVMNWNNFNPDLIGPRSARVTADGRYLLFSSDAPLTGYDSSSTACAPLGAPPGTSGPCQELYRYDAASGQPPTCLSCNPSGAPATGSATVAKGSPDNLATIQGSAPFFTNNMSADGRRVFFETPDSLVPADTNRSMDVYEWEDGQVHLISTGLDGSNSYFGDASVNGNDVFFVTRQALVSQDQDANVDMYDARVGGGFPAQEASPACSGDQCQGGLSLAPALPSPATATVFGVGNYVAPSAGHHGTSVRLSVAAVTTKARARFSKTGKLTLKITTSGAAKITVTALSRLGRKLKIVARAAKTQNGSGTATLTIKLSAAARRQLDKDHKLGLRVTVSTPGAHSRVARFTLTSRGR